jgi:hypothetical protein
VEPIILAGYDPKITAIFPHASSLRGVTKAGWVVRGRNDTKSGPPTLKDFRPRAAASVAKSE